MKTRFSKRQGIATIKGYKLYTTLEEHLQAFIEHAIPSSNGCLIYPTEHRYPNVKHEGRSRNFGTWLLISRGIENSRLVARHTCDNTRCVNPDHIIAGTQGDNIHDQITRGRGNHILQGKGRRRKLTEEQVREMHQLHATGNYTSLQLSSLFHISYSSVNVYLTRIF